MNRFRIWFVSILVVVSLVGGYFVYAQGERSGAYRYASETLETEVKSVRKENSEKEKQKENYLKAIQKNTEKLSQNEEQGKTIKGYYNEITDYGQKNSQLDADIQKATDEKDRLTQYNASLNEVSNAATEEPRTLTPGTYQCPTDLAAGRYRFSGTGSFRVVSNASNRVVDSQNLKNLDSNTYTMNIENEMKLITEGDITVTAVK